MKKNILITLLAALLLSSCGEYNKLLKSTDYEYKYEAAKNYFAKGQYNRAATLLNELIAILKGTDKAEESLYMLGMSYYNQKDYQTAAQTFIQYYNVYPRGTFTELARFHAGKALYLDTPEPRLDQSGTYSAIQQLQMFMEYFPQSSKKEEAQNMIFALQDKLVMKEYLSAKLYYNMGNYLGNNYQACVITAQNALKDYPYTNLREDLSILILRAKYELAVYSVEDRRAERYREAVDECYAFKNEFPESKYMKEVDRIFKEAQKMLGEGSEEQKIKTAEAQLGAAFLDARKYSDEIVSAANVKASDISAKASAEISEQAVEISKLTAEVNAISERFNRSIDELHSSIAALANKMSVSANELSKRKNAPSFVPDVSIKIDDENNITLQNTVDDNSKKIEDGFNLDSSTVFNFNKHKEG